MVVPDISLIFVKNFTTKRCLIKAMCTLFFIIFVPQGVSSEIGYLGLISAEKTSENRDINIVSNLRNFAKNEIFLGKGSLYVARKAITYDVDLLLENIEESSEKNATIYITGPGEVTSKGCAIIFSSERLLLDDLVNSISSIYSKKISLYLDLSIDDQLEVCASSLKNSLSVKIYFSSTGQKNIKGLFDPDEQFELPEFSDLSLAFISSYIDFSPLDASITKNDYLMNHDRFLSDFMINDQYDDLSDINLISANDSPVVNKYFKFFNIYYLPLFNENVIVKAARDQAVRDQAVRDQAARDQAARDQAARDQAARDQAARDQAVRDQAARDQAARDQAARDQAARDQAARDQAARDQAARDQAARDQAARDQAARDQAARDQAARDQAARDQAAREQAARDQAAREQAAREKRQAMNALEILKLQNEMIVLNQKEKIWQKRKQKAKLEGSINIIAAKNIQKIQKKKKELLEKEKLLRG
jgi:hypothetical protein